MTNSFIFIVMLGVYDLRDITQERIISWHSRARTRADTRYLGYCYKRTSKITRTQDNVSHF